MATEPNEAKCLTDRTQNRTDFELNRTRTVHDKTNFKSQFRSQMHDGEKSCLTQSEIKAKHYVSITCLLFVGIKIRDQN